MADAVVAASELSAWNSVDACMLSVSCMQRSCIEMEHR